MVSDRDIARKVNEVKGSTLDDVYEAWDRVRGRLDSRDDSETARAFKAVLDRYRASLVPTAGDGEADRKAAERLLDKSPFDFSEYNSGITEEFTEQIAAALQAARVDAEKDYEELYLKMCNVLDVATRGRCSKPEVIEPQIIAEVEKALEAEYDYGRADGRKEVEEENGLADAERELDALKAAGRKVNEAIKNIESGDKDITELEEEDWTLLFEARDELAALVGKEVEGGTIPEERSTR